MKPVIVVPTKTIPAIIGELVKAGYVPIPCDEPAAVVIVGVSNRVTGDDLLMAALEALTRVSSLEADATRGIMVKELAHRLKEREAKKRGIAL